MNKKINEILNSEGTESDIKYDLSKYLNINVHDSEHLFDLIFKNQALLSNDEFLLEKYAGESIDDTDGILKFLKKDASYHINIKFFTLALLCLIFDIKISKGFARFLLSFLGVNYSRTKLENFEKCVAYKIKGEKLSFEQLKPLIACNYAPLFNKNCPYFAEHEICQKWNENDIKETINSLLSKKIIKEKEGHYEIIF